MHIFTRRDSSTREYFARHLKSLALDLLHGTSNYHIVAKYLLQNGNVEDAISVCMREVTPIGRNIPSSKSVDSPTWFKLRAGISGKDFFTATINICENIIDIDERVRLLRHLHSFLQVWDPQIIKPARGEPPTEKSLLSQVLPDFPSALFGGENTIQANTLKAMFGY